jgi:sugar phosphate isomerase/epimerase
MNIGNSQHLTYCTNIHPGETWEAVFDSLQAYILPLKKALSPHDLFGIGLRLSDLASRTLIQAQELNRFKEWLAHNGLYVFTMNGFPYGGFHRQVVKDHVHQPDWTTVERLNYTIRLAEILTELLPDGMEGGISTSPISYRHWFKDNGKLEKAVQTGALHLAKVVERLVEISLRTGKIIHIDIEPEPDGIIDHTKDTIAFFEHQLIPAGVGYLMTRLAVTHAVAEEAMRLHVRVCYDVCHFAVMYERPADVIALFTNAGLRIGKIQISAALKAVLPETLNQRQKIAQQFEAFAESTYLHQVVAKHGNLTFTQYPDLSPALAHIYSSETVEWRSHFHVPVFIHDYGLLQSTQDDIIEALQVQKQKPFTQHLEVETYTWEVLPDALKVDLLSSIQREMEWVKTQLE